MVRLFVQVVSFVGIGRPLLHYHLSIGCDLSRFGHIFGSSIHGVFFFWGGGWGKRPGLA